MTQPQAWSIQGGMLTVAMPGAAGAAGATGAGGSLSVDPDNAQQLIDKLKEARDELQEIYNESVQLRGVEPPGKDPYSAMVVQRIAQAAGDDPGGYGYVNKKAREQLDNMISNLEAALRAYREAEDANRHSFGGRQ